MVTMLVGTGAGLFEFADGEVAATRLAGHAVGALADDEGGWWAIVDGDQVWHGGTDGQGWRLEATADQRLMCLASTPADVIVGTAGAHLLRLADGRLEPIEGFDGVAGRDQWYTPWGGPADTRSLAHDGAETTYANVHVGGIVASVDAQRSWHPTSIDIHADVHQVLAAAAPDVVLAACAEGLAVSTDAGDTWRIDDEGLHAAYSRAVAVAGDTVVISASTGPGGERSGLYRRPLGGAGPFERCLRGLPPWFEKNIDTGCLVARGDTVAFAAGDGSIFVSADGGASFDEVASGPDGVMCLALVDE
ncbi:MAG: WD40/YVTN/BNR-like repeat-containing protein [Acidimicrobiales bacterium]